LGANALSVLLNQAAIGLVMKEGLSHASYDQGINNPADYSKQP
jgi:hypothetical protein